MGLKDRLREAAQQAQEGLAKGQDKLEQFQNRQSIHEHLEALGQAYWLQQSGRATPEQLQALMDELSPAIEEGETRLGPLPWPTAPAGPDASTPAPSPIPASTVPSATPSSTPTPVPVPGTPPSSIPTAIHHDSMPPEA